MELPADVDRSRATVTHHDTHALPPQFVQDAYLHYNKIKLSDLHDDPNVVDFGRGLTNQQCGVIRPISLIPASMIRSAIASFDPSIPEHKLHSFDDVSIYEHQHFPGLQIVPGVLPLEAQLLFVSQILHHHLANQDHKTNLHTDYEIDYPKTRGQTQLSSPSSLFTFAPTDTHSRPKHTETHPCLNMVQFLSKRLRWLTIGDQYDWPTRSYKPNDHSSFPTDIANLVSGLFPQIKAESGVCLLYGRKNYMPVHRDVSEQCERPLASFSFGCDGIFLVARGDEEIDDPNEKQRRIIALRVRSGDCIYMSGESRWAWHAMARTISGTCPEALAQWPVGTPGATAAESKAYEKWKGFMGSKRLNVSCRQVWD